MVVLHNLFSASVYPWSSVTGSWEHVGTPDASGLNVQLDVAIIYHKNGVMLSSGY